MPRSRPRPHPDRRLGAGVLLGLLALPGPLAGPAAAASPVSTPAGAASGDRREPPVERPLARAVQQAWSAGGTVVVSAADPGPASGPVLLSRPLRIAGVPWTDATWRASVEPLLGGQATTWQGHNWGGLNRGGSMW